MKIAVGMSGGVDSSVAALILKNEGHEVHGITMKIWDGPASESEGVHACYGPGEASEIRRAAEVCEAIGIPHTVYDLSKEYRSTIVEYFRNEYKAGRTPNPCVECNMKMKFSLLPSIAARDTDFEAYATGHYVRKVFDPESGRFFLKTAVDEMKDQSYFLYRLTRRELSMALFPLGTLTKAEVRKIAEEYSLPVKDDPESQDFYEGDYRELIGDCGREGDFVDTGGSVLGKHRGIASYTVGQRRGLGISGSDPLYVLRIDSGSNRIILGRKDEALTPSFLVNSVNRALTPSYMNSFSASVKIRSSHSAIPCTIAPVSESVVRVIPAKPVKFAAPGQSAVFYNGDILIGGGIIEYDNRD